MDEIELIRKDEGESDRFIKWLIVNDLRLDRSTKFWWDSPQAEAQLQSICCGDNEISVHVRYCGDDEPGAYHEFHADAPLDPQSIERSNQIIERSKDVVVYDCSYQANSQTISSDAILQLYRALDPGVSCQNKHKSVFAASSRK